MYTTWGNNSVYCQVLTHNKSSYLFSLATFWNSFRDSTESIPGTILINIELPFLEQCEWCFTFCRGMNVFSNQVISELDDGRWIPYRQIQLGVVFFERNIHEICRANGHPNIVYDGKFGVHVNASMATLTPTQHQKHWAMPCGVWMNEWMNGYQFGSCQAG